MAGVRNTVSLRPVVTTLTVPAPMSTNKRGFGITGVEPVLRANCNRALPTGRCPHHGLQPVMQPNTASASSVFQPTATTVCLCLPRRDSNPHLDTQRRVLCFLLHHSAPLASLIYHASAFISNTECVYMRKRGETLWHLRQHRGIFMAT